MPVLEANHVTSRERGAGMTFWKNELTEISPSCQQSETTRNDRHTGNSPHKEWLIDEKCAEALIALRRHRSQRRSGVPKPWAQPYSTHRFIHTLDIDSSTPFSFFSSIKFKEIRLVGCIRYSLIWLICRGAKDRRIIRGKWALLGIVTFSSGIFCLGFRGRWIQERAYMGYGFGLRKPG